ncbi:phenol hydroxylase (plasmid) [Sphingobium sp. SCG-1]|uniref:NADH:ubiquinone reductase (Na(+)-transporting) subunit F n=1 Tax=Sphingobium sp. SCG-1 TaxID=2072936 RepID=UPI000CD69254|nr:2Fe-2S iron-sulfur cluster binding domain-containing protein [Sphingobium sp. SCG-1]AUW60555.1 phenol hydroxylase [Sphingobium sp. SCG-1]
MTYQLTIEPLGETVVIEDGQTILDACLRSGIYLPYQCNHGLCSTCKLSVIDGEVDHGAASPFALMDYEREEGRALACCATAMSDLTIEADVEVDPDALHLEVRDVVGTVRRFASLTPDILGIWLAIDGEGMPFQAGQYVNVDIPGCAEPRSFSIASSPVDPNLLELHIRKVPGGVGTEWLHANVVEGLRLRLTGPLGRFFVRASSADPIIFLAGGSGLSSPKSMSLDLLEKGWEGSITLIHGVRTAQDLYFADEFRSLEKDYPSFRYVPVLSQAADDEVWGGSVGFVHQVAEELFEGSFKGHKAYLCGPPPMIDACIRSLMKGRLFEKDIFTETFLTKSDGESLAKSPLFKKI